jgi:hypothetical protein
VASKPVRNVQHVPVPHPNRSADAAYYRGANVSAINNSGVMTRRGIPGTPLQTARTPHHADNDTNTDRYYRDGGSRQSQRGQPTGKIDVPMTPHKLVRGGKMVPVGNHQPQHQPGTTFQAEGAGAVAVPIRIRNKGDVAPAKEAIFSAINRGETRVFVEVADAECERRIRAAIDLGVAREQIAEDRARDVVIKSLAVSGADLAKQMFGEVKPPTHVENVERGQTGSGAEIDDFDAFVKGSDPVVDDDSPTTSASAVGVSTGVSEDPVVAAARNARGAEGERPLGREGGKPEKPDKKDKKWDGKRPRMPVQSKPATEPSAVVDPVVKAAAAENQAAAQSTAKPAEPIDDSNGDDDVDE